MTTKQRQRKFAFFISLVLTLFLIANQSVQMGRGASAQNAGEQTQEKRGGGIYAQACIQCHNATPTVIQRKTVEGWRRTVYSMISRGAWLMPDEIEPLIAYLSATYGPGSPTPGERVNTDSLPEAPGKAILERSCVQCHTLEMVTSARLSELEWEETIERMKIYGAKFGAEEQKILAIYMASHFRIQ